ncbi:MAG: type IV pilus modification protein PilV [Moraxellaceae bacterium]|nr:type IV pilus modification protein PilV [Moraxellaceae bacterium]
MNIIISPKISSQQGVGLIEVLVSLLLLAVAILGFSAMQLRAVQATDESMARNRALTKMRAGAEMMRANPPEYKESFQNTLQDLYPKFAGDDIKQQYDTLKAKCSNTMCPPQELAEKDATALAYSAQQQDIKVNMIDCPATGAKFDVIDGAGIATPINNTRHCFIASWGNTEPTNSGANNCISESGNYRLGATCFVMETY